ncbi:MAG TPA: thymidylate synthase [Thermoanaerobaculia bacterium]|nr:thymidylate synthase [Thermoanaerobaculia bacterium]
MRELNITTAIARFVWMVAGSDRLEDIAFYEPMVRRYTDNNISVPGSSYGMRLFQPRPGVNQIEGVTQRLSADKTSRRAAAVIWSPDDAVRESRDIPCAFGVFFHVRANKLISTLVMRSNNAVTLLPFNVFEFSLLGEMIARSVGADLGPFVYTAVSMHVFDRDRTRAEEIIAAYDTTKVITKVMPPMPSDPPPIEQANRLAQLEAKMRHSHANFTEATTQSLLSEATDYLDSYWLAFYRVLLSHAFLKAHQPQVAVEVAAQLPVYFRKSVEAAIASDPLRAGSRVPSDALQLELGIGGSRDATADAFEMLRREYSPSAEELLAGFDELTQLCDEISRNSPAPISFPELNSLAQRLLGETMPVAARTAGETVVEEASRAHRRISREEILAELSRIRRSR